MALASFNAADSYAPFVRQSSSYLYADEKGLRRSRRCSTSVRRRMAPIALCACRTRTACSTVHGPPPPALSQPARSRPISISWPAASAALKPAST
ncbi:MAG: hypothetical protein JWO65_262 [Sphingomonas bacterium]|nr:hypothetical protein [Sphingomonas bacterium]